MPQHVTADLRSAASMRSRVGSGAVLSLDAARQRRARLASRDVIRVAVVASHAITRAGLRRLLDDDAGLAVVGEASADADAAALIRATDADVIVVDADCVGPEPRWSEVLDGRSPVLLLITSDAEEHLLAALRAGATGMLAKDSHPAELASAIRTLARGGALLPPRIARRLIAELVHAPAPS